MALQFVNGEADEASLAAGIDNLSEFSGIVLINPSQTSAARTILGKGDNGQKNVATRPSGNLFFRVRRGAPNHATAETNDAPLNAGGWTAVCFTYDVTDGPRIFTRSLAGTFAESSYVTRVTGSGSLEDDSAASWKVSATSFAFDGLVQFFHLLGRRLTSTTEMDALFAEMLATPDTLAFMHLGYVGNSGHDLSAGQRAVTVTGAIGVPNSPLPLWPSLASYQPGYAPPTSTGVTGTGAATLGALTGAGAARADVQGAGAGSLSGMQAAGVATVHIAGAGVATIPAFVGQGSGVIAVSGIGAGVLAALTAAGAAVLDVAGDGSAMLAALVASGDGTVAASGSINGSGAAHLAALLGAGIGTVRVRGLGAAQLGALLAAGMGRVAIDAEGAAMLAALQASGTGTVLVRGNGAALLAALEAAGVGIAGDAFRRRITIQLLIT